MLYSLIYVSEMQVSEDQSGHDNIGNIAQSIRTVSIELNGAAGVTGLLLHTEQHFCQLLQGSKSAVEQTMQRILRDDRHSNPIVLLRTDFSDELFPDWSMATCLVDTDETAAVISRAHRSGIVEPADVEKIVDVLQQHRYAENIGPSVVSLTSTERVLSAIWTNRASEEACSSFLDLGAQMSGNTDLVLLLMQPATRQLRIKTTIKSLPGGLQEVLSLSRTECEGWSSKQINYSAKSAELPQAIVSCCNQLDYQQAEGFTISLSLPGDTAESHPVATLWFLDRNIKDSPTSVPGLNGSRKNYVRCLESLIQQQSVIMQQELLQQKLQRQKLALTASLHRQHLILNVVSSAIVAMDSEGRVLMINEAARKLFGLDFMEVPFRWPDSIEFFDLSLKVLLGDEEQPVQRAVASSKNTAGDRDSRSIMAAVGWEKIYQNLTVALRSDGRKRAVYLRCSAVAVAESDSALSSVIVFDDITELENNRDKIRRKDRLEALGQLTGGIAHDFNNLLSTILSSAELAITEGNKRERNKLLGLTIETVNRGSELANRLVGFAVALPARSEVRPLKDILEGVVELATVSVSKDVELIVDQVPDSFALSCDSRQLENALLNLLMNSRDAIVESGTGSRVHLRVKPLEAQHDEPARIEISVIDDGPGMLESDIPRATDPFFTTKDSGVGSGLGLSMVYGFLQQISGDLQIENVTRGVGLRVSMVLDQAALEVVPEVPSEVAVEQKSDCVSILLVEDDLQLGRLLQKSLGQMGHYVCYCTNSTDALISLAGDKKFNLLITDVVLRGGGLDGFSLARIAIQRMPHLKVLYVSGYAPPDTAEALLHGPVLTKPVSMKLLAESIQNELADEALQ